MERELPYNSDCLIYNSHGDVNDRTVIKHVLDKVWWRETSGVTTINKGVQSANSVEIIMTKREGYLLPTEWQALTREAAESGKYFTIQEDDRVIKGTPEAPDTFTSTVRVTEHFGLNCARQIMSIGEAVLPDGIFHHFRIGCK